LSLEADFCDKSIETFSNLSACTHVKDCRSLYSLICNKQAALGTNPIAFAAPGKDGDHFVLDMATTAVAVGKVRSPVVLNCMKKT
jgi:hypothetical protein